MDINEIINFLKDVPTWGWVVFAIVILILFGDRECWEYEVKFSFIDGSGNGEIEIESVGNKIFKNREKKTIEIELNLNLEAQNKSYDIFLNRVLIQTINKNSTHSSRIIIRENFVGEEPSEDDIIEIKHSGTSLYSGKLRKD